ncbi:MAG: helix-turn-helix transcriptional regulator [Cryobacterium sp.]|nr:helix-turn-helix transcriptional regulator [Cryobacterium sp.]
MTSELVPVILRAMKTTRANPILAKRLQQARDAANLSQADLARRVDMSQTAIGEIEAGRVARPKKLREIALEVGTSEAWLLGETDSPDPDHQLPSPEAAQVVGVIGMIGAGGAFDTSVEQIAHGEPLYEIELPFFIGPDAIALEVKGDSMWPRYDPGDVIVCFRRTVDPETLLGWEAAVGTPDGSRYLKRLLRGSAPGLYNLESHNAPPIRDVHLDWVSDVGAVVRAHLVRRANKSVKASIVRQLKGRGA